MNLFPLEVAETLRLFRALVRATERIATALEHIQERAWEDGE